MQSVHAFGSGISLFDKASPDFGATSALSRFFSADRQADHRQYTTE
jgi:hypothetical protein